MNRLLLTIGLSLLLSLSLVSQERRLAIVGATVMDGTGAEPRAATVLIRGARIEAVLEGQQAPDGYLRIDASRQTLIPGLFDVHTHLPYSAGRAIEGDLQKNLLAYLYCGVTTTVDFGTYPETFEPTRRLIAEGKLQSPRLLRAARFSTPGGHGLEGGRGDFTSEVTTPAEASAALREILAFRPEALKVFTDGWRYGVAPEMTSMREDTLAALVKDAHSHGIPVLTHTVSKEKAKTAARAGVDVIAHGVSDEEVDAELVSLMRKHGTRYAPTLAVYEPLASDYTDPLLEEVVEAAVRDSMKPVPGRPAAMPSSQARLRWERLMQNNRLLHRAGIPFTLGTDAGVTGTFHGWATLRELKLLVDGGLSPLEALTAATGNSARALGIHGDRGFVKPGLAADLVLVEGSPHRNILDVLKIRRVFVGGVEIDRQRLLSGIARPGMLPLQRLEAEARLDDFERTGFRTLAGSRWVSAYDSGHDHSRVSYARILSGAGNHVLSVHAVMAHKPRPFVRLVLPLSPGAMQTVDARRFRGISFRARGEGSYRLRVRDHSVRDDEGFSSPFELGPEWIEMRIPFDRLKHAPTGASPERSDLRQLEFEIAREPGDAAWLELDDVGFF